MKPAKLNQNNLRRYRKRSGLEQKQLAFLLNQKSTDEVSRYETGIHRPNLETAFKLQVIFHVPIALIYHRLFEHCQVEIAELKRQHPHLLPDSDWFPASPEQLKQEEFCFYGEILKGRIPNELEIRTVDKHILNLMNTTAVYRQGRNPY